MTREEYFQRQPQVLQKLFEEDKKACNLDTGDLFRSDQTFNKRIKSRLVELGYSEIQAESCVYMAAWNYILIENSYLYRELEGYSTTVKSHISKKCQENNISEELLLAVTSILHWKRTLIHTTNKSWQAVVILDGVGKGENIWHYCYIKGCGLINIPDCLEQGKTPLPILEKSFLEELAAIEVTCDSIELMRNTMCRNLIKTYGFQSFIENESAASIMFESVYHFIKHNTSCKIEEIITPLYIAMGFLTSTLKSQDYFGSESSREGLLNNIISRSLDDLSLPSNSLDWNVLDEYPIQWQFWRRLNNPPQEVHNLIYAIFFNCVQGYEKFTDFFKKKLYAHPEFQEFIDRFRQLYELCGKIDSKTLYKYQLQGRVNYFKIGFSDDETDITDDWNEPRDIRTIYADLDMPDLVAAPDTIVPEPQTVHEEEVSGNYGVTLDEYKAMTIDYNKEQTYEGSKLRHWYGEDASFTKVTRLFKFLCEYDNGAIANTPDNFRAFIYRFTWRRNASDNAVKDYQIPFLKTRKHLSYLISQMVLKKNEYQDDKSTLESDVKKPRYENDIWNKTHAANRFFRFQDGTQYLDETPPEALNNIDKKMIYTMSQASKHGNSERSTSDPFEQAVRKFVKENIPNPNL